MNPNSDLKNNESIMAANAESSTVDAGYAESRISEYAARFAAYSDERFEADRRSRAQGSWLGQRAQLLPRRPARRV